MSTIPASFSRDYNRVPITTDGIIISDAQSFTANGTVVVPIFKVTGTVEVRGLWGVVTTALGSNFTAAYWRLNDQSNQSNITLNTGTALSSAAAGSVITKAGLAGAALTLLNATQERVAEPTTLETPYFSPFLAVQKPTIETDIEFIYTTNNTSAGTIQFFVRFLPISSDGNITAL